jgi:type IV pilus assembly protein PilM
VKKLFQKIFQSNKGIGVEFSPERVNIAQLHSSRQGIKLDCLVSIPMPSGVFADGLITNSSAIAQIIQQGLIDNKISAHRVAAAIPAREAIIRSINLPAELSDEELREVVLNHEASLYLPYKREETDIDYQKLGDKVDVDGIEKIEVLLVATRKDITDSYISAFELAGLHLDILEVSSFALIRIIHEKLRQFRPQEAVVLVNIEFDSTEIAIAVNGIPQFSRTVPIGTYQLQSALLKAMNLPASRDMELLQGIPMAIENNNPVFNTLLKELGELTDEVHRSINFCLSQSENLEVVEVLLAGPGGALLSIDDFFIKRLGLPTTKIDPIISLALQVDEDEYPLIHRPGFGVALGLAMRICN